MNVPPRIRHKAWVRHNAFICPAFYGEQEDAACGNYSIDYLVSVVPGSSRSWKRTKTLFARTETEADCSNEF
jgi:hypothetical protein